MSDSFLDSDRFERPARLTLAPKIGAVIAAKVSDIANTAPGLTDGQRKFIASALWFEPKDALNPLPLLDADSFRVSFVSSHDKERDEKTGTVDEPDEGSGNYAVSVHLYRDGSPFVYEEDLSAGVRGSEYTILVGPDAPPTLVHQEHLEIAAIDRGNSRQYAHGSWRDLSRIVQDLGRDFIHTLDDQDCENLLAAVTSAAPKAETLISEMSAAEGFDKL